MQVAAAHKVHGGVQPPRAGRAGPLRRPD
jgi:hypothetical protein